MPAARDMYLRYAICDFVARYVSAHAICCAVAQREKRLQLIRRFDSRGGKVPTKTNVYRGKVKKKRARSRMTQNGKTEPDGVQMYIERLCFFIA